MPKMSTLPANSAAGIKCVSPDGYIRLTFDQFQALPLMHLCSGLDDGAMPESTAEGACATSISGYTEWVSAATSAEPVITIGWSWSLDGSSSGIHCFPTDAPGHNLMFLDAAGRDIGLRATTLALEAWRQRFDWEQQVLLAVSAPSEGHAARSCQH